MPKSFDPHFLY